MKYSTREFDHNGLLMCEFQAKLFEKSVDVLNCSSLVFIRRLIKSDLLMILDKNDSSVLDYDFESYLKNIDKQFNNDYGSNKYNKEIMFWLGYVYRYISYTRNVSTKLIYKLFKPNEIKELYYVYHTLDNEEVIDRLLAARGLDESVFDPNYRLKELMVAENIYYN